MTDFNHLVRSFFGRIAATKTGAAAEKINGIAYALDCFLQTGNKEDALVVYYAFCEAFDVFGEGYSANTRTMLEVLCEYESVAGAVNMKHRDHYGHSAYVFALGIALYENGGVAATEIRRAPFDAETFLYRWGCVSLFHDVGYPFEMAYESIKSYSTRMDPEGDPRRFAPSVGYCRLDRFNALSEEESALLAAVYPDAAFRAADEALFRRLTDLFGEGVGSFDAFRKRAEAPEDPFMDHAYFGAVVLLKRLLHKIAGQTAAKDDRKAATAAALDLGTAILLHNSFYRYGVEARCNCSPEALAACHPLAYFLMIADEIQCWDRDAYGIESKKEVQPWGLDFEVRGDRLCLTYLFDAADRTVDGVFAHKLGKTLTWLLGEGYDNIKIGTEVRRRKKPKRDAFSTEFFGSLIESAVITHAGYLYSLAQDAVRKHAVSDWDGLSPAMKLSNIAQVKSYPAYLAAIGCFARKQSSDAAPVEALTEEEVERIASLEHDRWIKFQEAAGWRYGPERNDAEKIHDCMVAYEELPESVKEYDRAVARRLIDVYRRCGLTVYRKRRKEGALRPGCYRIAVVGHRDWDENEREGIERKLTALFAELKEREAAPVVVTGLADGADQLAAECALRCGLEIEAVFPARFFEFRKTIAAEDKFADLIGKLSDLTLATQAEGDENEYQSVLRTILDRSDEAVALWDGEARGGAGGTYDAVKQCRRRKIPLTVIATPRKSRRPN